VLEAINGSVPLPKLLEEITDLISFGLNGAPCWCEVAEGAPLGRRPNELDQHRIVCEEIRSREGVILGTLFAATDSEATPLPTEQETFYVGSRLATLAIETRRLYSDLVHRSEFDLLTDVHNRFSLDNHLDALVERARAETATFGLIYIDLDEFKQVNDRYGHGVGDLYLKEVTQRMKGQLRTSDLLARLGGDEFAVLVSVVRNRSHLDEIALRLQQCFDNPYTVDGYLLRGSASVGIALYPEDGTTKENLLKAADAAMYVAKNMARIDDKQATAHPDR
jgi:diguanylate cyclase (GGDEF)-like protein